MAEQETAKRLREIVYSIAKREYESFADMCPKGQNPVMSVLRVHLLTEYNIERFFHVLLPRGDRLSNVSLSYAQKLCIVESLDEIDDRIIQCLKNLNKVRNACAHEHDKEITIADVELIGRPLGKEHTKIRTARIDGVSDYLRNILRCICRNLSTRITYLEYQESQSENTSKESIQPEDGQVSSEGTPPDEPSS